jgi:anaerobic selenocysteine-containing dehydrogenase
MALQDIVKTTCPRDCYDACGIAVVRRDGAIAKVLGDPDHGIARGALCGKCAIAYNGAWRDPALRLATPLKRTGAKGEGRFAPISWGEALTTIAMRLRGLLDADQARTILHTHYTGTVGLIGGWYPIRFFNRIGATEVDPDTVCNKAGHVVLEAMFGSSLEGFDPRTVADTRTILVWGANPSHSAPHQNRVWLKAAKAAGKRIVAIDPIGHDTALAADIHLKLRPGTDAALAFALIHVIAREGLLEEDFIVRHVTGWEALAGSIAETTPARAAELCGVSVAAIEEVARLYAGGPSLLWLGQGVQRQPNGGNVFRALGALIASCGQTGAPGRGFLYMNGPGVRGVDMATLTAPHLAAPGMEMVSHMDLAAVLEDGNRVKAFFNWNNNPAASSPQQARVRAALARDDLFHVAVDLFQTDTTAYADIVLPAASFLECDDLVLSYFDLTLSAQVKAAEPPGEALPNAEIFRRLAAAMGFEDGDLFESDDALIARLLAETPYAGSFRDLAEAGTVTLFPEPRIQFAGHAFPTTSGRIELAGDAWEEKGLPRAPLPLADAPPATGSIRVLSPASSWQMNSSYGNDPAIRGRLGEPTVALHPDDAAAFGVNEGDPVVLANGEGSLPLLATLSDAAQPGMGIVHKGRWPGASPGRANVNVLVSGAKSDIAESTTVHGTVVTLLRRDAAE